MTDHQPNGLEDRIRDAYQSAARTVQTLQRPSPVLAAGSVRRPRRMNLLAPIAAAAAVIVIIAASVALPRLLTGAPANPATPHSASGIYPPFQVVLADRNNSDSSLRVESAATGHVVATVALPWSGAEWGASVGVITGRTTRQWSIGGLTSTGAGNLGIFDVSVSSDGNMVAFITESQTAGLAAWVLPTGSAPGSITARARQVYRHRLPAVGPGNKVSALDSALISPDGSTLYIATTASSASGQVVTTLTAYRTAGGASPRAVTAFNGGFYGDPGEQLTPAGGGMLLAWNNEASTAYLINPATRTRTTLELHGVPSLRFTVPPQLTNVILAW